MIIKCTIKYAVAAFLALSMLIPISVGFAISGASFIEEVSPSQKLLHEITVMNNGENATPLNMTAEIYGFARSLDGVNIELSPENDTSSFTARPFLTIEPKSFHLEPGERKTLLLTGTVPQDVGSGGRYALVTIKTTSRNISAPQNARGGISVSTAIQVPVLLTIKDSEITQSGNITKLEASKSNEGVAVGLIFENTGNVHYKPFVEIALKDKNGDILAKEGPEQISGSVLPTNSRLHKADLVPKTDLVPGAYTIEAKVTTEKEIVLDSKETTFKV